MRNRLSYWQACKESIYAPVESVRFMRRETMDLLEALLGMVIKLIALAVHILAAVLFPLTAVILVIANRKILKRHQERAEANKKWQAETNPWGDNHEA